MGHCAPSIRQHAGNRGRIFLRQRMSRVGDLMKRHGVRQRRMKNAGVGRRRDDISAPTATMVGAPIAAASAESPAPSARTAWTYPAGFNAVMAVRTAAKIPAALPVRKPAAPRAWRQRCPDQVLISSIRDCTSAATFRPAARDSRAPAKSAQAPRRDPDSARRNFRQTGRRANGRRARPAEPDRIEQCQRRRIVARRGRHIRKRQRCA